MFRTVLALFLLSWCRQAQGQAPAWQSAQAVAVATAGATNTFSSVAATAVDAAGNVYLAGSFTNTVVLGGFTLTSLGADDLFVAKFNPVSNQFVWAQRAGGTGNDRVSALAVNGTSVYIAGDFASPTVGFGSATLTNAGTGDVFVAKLIDAGNSGSFMWAQRAGGTGEDRANALALSGTSVYVAGNSSSLTAGFGPVTLTNTPNNSSVFVAKLTDAGSTGGFVWLQQAVGGGATALAVSGASVYVTGAFFNPTTRFGTTILTNARANGTDDIFVAKLIDAGITGSFTWAQRAGGAGYDGANALAVSGTNIYVAGGFGGPTANFGTITLTNADVNGANGFRHDVFVAKLTDTGSFAWAQRAGGIDLDIANALSVSGNRIYVAGYFRSSTADFSTITLANPNPTNVGFLASLTDATLTATAAAGPRAAVALFPNPAYRTATLRLPAGTERTPLILTDALGRTTRQYPAPTGRETVLDLRGLPAGLYVLRGAGAAQHLVVE